MGDREEKAGSPSVFALAWPRLRTCCRTREDREGCFLRGVRLGFPVLTARDLGVIRSQRLRACYVDVQLDFDHRLFHLRLFLSERETQTNSGIIGDYDLASRIEVSGICVSCEIFI